MSSGSRETAFEQNAQSFYEYGQAVRGYVRYSVVHRNLEPLLVTPNLEIVDVGGGSGLDAVWAAQLGHHVTVIEPAKAQLELAGRRIARLKEEDAQRIELFHGTTTDFLKDQRGHFDMVFCHGVAMYLSKPATLAIDLVALAKLGGHISLLEKGYYGTEARLISERKFDDLTRLQTTHRVVNRQARDVYAFQPEELTELLTKAGAYVLEWSGVRVVSESLSNKVQDMDPAVLLAIVDTEYNQGHDPSIRGQGQMLHFLAEKTMLN